MDASKDMTRVSGKGPVSGEGSKAQRGEGINRFDMKHVISYPVQVSGFAPHHGTLVEGVYEHGKETLGSV